MFLCEISKIYKNAFLESSGERLLLHWATKPIFRFVISAVVQAVTKNIFINDFSDIKGKGISAKLSDLRESSFKSLLETFL